MLRKALAPEYMPRHDFVLPIAAHEMARSSERDEALLALSTSVMFHLLVLIPRTRINQQLRGETEALPAAG
jgi:hypothetical protein